MNNYENMNYFMSNIPIDFSYLNQKQPENTINNMYQYESINQNSVMPLNNLNFNKCNYDGKSSPDNLFSSYEGFIRGNMFPDLYNKYNQMEPYKISSSNEQEKMLTNIDAYCFAAHDLNLYLDTHPEDKNMIDLYNKYIDETNQLINQYENMFGPLFVNSNQTTPWSWNKKPWPWENN